MLNALCICIAVVSLLLNPASVIGQDWSAAMEEGKAYLNVGRYQDAIGAYENAAVKAPDPDTRARAILQVGDIYGYFLYEYDRALENYETLKKSHPRSPSTANAYFNAGMILYEKNRHEEAYGQFKAYSEKYPRAERRDAAIFMMEVCTKPDSGDGRRKKEEKIPLPLNPQIRVLLLGGVREVCIGGTPSVAVKESREGTPTSRLKTACIETDNGSLRLNGRGRSGEELTVLPEEGGMLSLGGAPYRGEMRILRSPGGGMDVINILPLESYLYGVVPREMSARWFSEALKAQAVAARTYALYMIDKNKSLPYDVFSTTASQVYGGAAAEAETSNRAINETRGIVLFYEDRPALAYFHAHSGGMTEDAKHVWEEEFPYLKSVRDDYSLKAPGCSWTRTVGLDGIRQALNKNKMALGVIKRMTIENASPSGRITKIRIIHEGAETILSGNDFRIKTDPVLIRSTFFSLTQQGQEITFVGRGYGHGVGMSQWGAYVMAQEGRSYRDILRYYYPGVEIRIP